MLQKRMVRAIFDLLFSSHTNNVFKENLKVPDVYNFRLRCFFSNMLNYIQDRMKVQVSHSGFEGSLKIESIINTNEDKHIVFTRVSLIM